MIRRDRLDPLKRRITFLPIVSQIFQLYEEDNTIRKISKQVGWLMDLCYYTIYWPKQSVKELMNNAYDFLNDYYPDGTKETRKIVVHPKIDSILDGDERSYSPYFRYETRTFDDLTVFETLEPIFDYTQFRSTKRHQHRIITRALGDYLKRALGYRSSNYNRVFF